MHKATEQDDDTKHRKFIAVVWVVILLKPYLEGQEITDSTEPDAFKRILTSASFGGRLTRWRLRHFEFDFKVVRRFEIKNQNTDKFSKLEQYGTKKTLVEGDIPEPEGVLLQHINRDNDKHGGSLADKYCACENSNFTFGWTTEWLNGSSSDCPSKHSP